VGLLEKLLGKQGGDEGPVIDIKGKGMYDESIFDMEEKRTLTDVPKLKKAIIEYQEPGNIEKREIFTFEEEKKNYPDFYLPYYWVATYHFDKNNFDQAKDILMEGISKSKMKSVLCRRLAEFYFLKNKFESALYWFFTAIMANKSNVDFHSYMYLGYIFEEHGMKDASNWARRRARGITYRLFYDSAEYSHKKRDKIKQITSLNKNEHTGSLLRDFYRYAKKNIGYL
jgi:hypothetical protein